MKIKIIYKFQNKPTGGTNQFLKALKNHFQKLNIYTNSDEKADVFLFNAYQYIFNVIELRKKFPEKIFIHRIDGPIKLYAKMSDKRDEIINTANKYLADATVFQSQWSRNQNYKLGLEKNNFETTITNAPDKNIFNTKNKIKFSRNRKIKIIATSWSSWHKKGFDVYKWLDENLDFEKYEMTFCGNSSVKFKNIKSIKPLPSKELANQLKQNDIFITASQKDPCSNALTEALHCGLPAIVLNDGGHPEIIKNAGEIFNDKKEIPEFLEKIFENYENYISKIENPNIDEITQKYFDFFENILNKKKNNTFLSKKINILQIFHLKFLLLKLKIKSEINKTFLNYKWKKTNLKFG